MPSPLAAFGILAMTAVAIPADLPPAREAAGSRGVSRRAHDAGGHEDQHQNRTGKKSGGPN